MVRFSYYAAGFRGASLAFRKSRAFLFGHDADVPYQASCIFRRIIEVTFGCCVYRTAVVFRKASAFFIFAPVGISQIADF